MNQRRLVERALQSEMNNHLGYSKYNQSDAQNSRNGYNTKNLITKNGAVIRCSVSFYFRC
nr:transposase [Rickettsia felis]